MPGEVVSRERPRLRAAAKGSLPLARETNRLPDSQLFLPGFPNYTLLKQDDSRAVVDPYSDNSGQFERLVYQVPGRDGQRVVDEEEFMLMKQLRETKNKIRAAMKERKNIKTALVQGEHEISRCKVELVNAFSAW